MNRKHRFLEQNLTDTRNFMVSALTKTVARKARYDCAAKKYGVHAGIIRLVLIALLCTADFSELSGGMHGKTSPASKLETQTPVDDAENTGPQTAGLRNEPIWRITLAGMASVIPNAKLQNEAKQRKKRDNPLHRNGLRPLTSLNKSVALGTTVRVMRATGRQTERKAADRASHERIPRICQTPTPASAPAIGRPVMFVKQLNRLFSGDALASITEPQPCCVGVMRAGNRPIHPPGGT